MVDRFIGIEEAACSIPARSIPLKSFLFFVTDLLYLSRDVYYRAREDRSGGSHFGMLMKQQPDIDANKIPAPMPDMLVTGNLPDENAGTSSQNTPRTLESIT